jgi:ribonuclease Z
MSLLGRVAPLHLYAPAALKPIIDDILKVADTVLSYPFFFHELPEGTNTLFENEYFSVINFPVNHRIECHGFMVTRKTKGRKLLPDMCKEYNIPPDFYEALKQGQDYTAEDGSVVKNELVTTDGPSVKKYAYCADTSYIETYLPIIDGADTIYHECTYLEKDADKAAARFHSTAIQAAQIAKKANAKQLLLGHFSSKYRDLEPFRDEAKTVFENVFVTVEGTAYEV